MNIIEYISKKLNKNNSNNNFYIQRLRNNGASVFDYDFMMSASEKDYSKYLAQVYFIKTGQKLNLKHPKNINEKIQWLKIYDNLPIKTQLTDKFLVRDWIKNKIGDEYLKPLLSVCSSFDEIDFESLPDSFIVKCNHGCKWHIIVKNKINFLNNKQLYDCTRNNVNSWLSQTFFGWSDFETQYKNIEPKLIIEPLMRDDIDNDSDEFEIWCFNSKAKIYQKRFSESHVKISTFDENFNCLDITFSPYHTSVKMMPDNLLKKAVELSNILAENFKLVRVDWLIYKGHLYFNEMTFTPYSGYIIFDEKNQNWYKKLGKMLDLKGN